MKHLLTLLAALMLAPAVPGAGTTKPDNDTKTLRVFIFAGQSNMVGSDSKAKDIKRFPPFSGLDMPQEKVLFSFNIGREEKLTSEGWIALSILLYLVTGAFWIPVVFMQIRMRDLAQAAARTGRALPVEYHRLFRRWFAFGFPAFGAMLAIIWLMIAKPALL